MRISLISPTETYPLEWRSQTVKLYAPLAVLQLQLSSGEACELTLNGEDIHCEAGASAYPIRLTHRNSDTVKLKTGQSAISLKISCAGVRAAQERDVENLMHFVNSLEMLPTPLAGGIAVTDLIAAIETGRITLLSVQKPLTGYDNQSLLDKLQTALTQKVRAICTSPKQGTKIEELVQDVSLVKRINSNTLSHLASHTEHWKARTLSGLVPQRLKADIIEDEINIYENLFFKMAVDDIEDYTNRQILALQAAKGGNEAAIDWEAYGAKINDYRRSALLQKLLVGRDTGVLAQENKVFDRALQRWLWVSRSLVSIHSSAFYQKISSKRTISKSVHLTNILKNDQRYKALYDIWCLVQKERQWEQQEQKGASHDISDEAERYYATYSALALLYAMSLLDIQFSETAQFSLSGTGSLTINADAQDECFRYHISDGWNEYGCQYFDITIQERLDVTVEVPDECVLSRESFSALDGIASYSEGDRLLHLHKKLDSIQRTALKNILRKPQSEIRKLSLPDKTRYQKAFDSWNALVDSLISDRRLHDPRVRTLRVVPLLAVPQPEPSSLERFTNALFETNQGYTCYLLPHFLEAYRDIRKPYLLRRLFNYGEAYYEQEPAQWKDYKVAVLPVLQTDIGTIHRLMKLISLHRSRLIMEYEQEQAVHCPICGQKHIRAMDGDTWKCQKPDCGIEWGKTRCTKGCGAYFGWIRPEGRFKKYDFDVPSECGLILKKDSLFDKYIITDFEFKENSDGTLTSYPICPKCGAHRF